MHCPHCLYDLSRTQLPRCPECGRAFDRKNAETFLQTGTRWAALQFQFSRLLRNSIGGTFSGDRMFCRECFANLESASNEKCPVCGKWFKHNDRSTYRKSDHSFVRLFERFKHICIGRGVLIPLFIAAYGVYCLVTRTAFLPGSNESPGMAAQSMDLTGRAAIAMGLGWLGLATALHCRYFWGHVEPIWRVAELGFIAGLLTLAGGWIAAIAWAILEALH